MGSASGVAQTMKFLLFFAALPAFGGAVATMTAHCEVTVNNISVSEDYSFSSSTNLPITPYMCTAMPGVKYWFITNNVGIGDFGSISLTGFPVRMQLFPGINVESPGESHGTFFAWVDIVAHMQETFTVQGGSGPGFLKGASTYSTDGANITVTASSMSASWTGTPPTNAGYLPFELPFIFGEPITITLDGHVAVSSAASGGSRGYGFVFYSSLDGILDANRNPVPNPALVASIPEPGTFWLMALALYGLVMKTRARRYIPSHTAAR